MDVAAFLGVCRVKSPERDRLLTLCQGQNTPGWLQQHGSRLPKQLVTLIDHENKAVTIGDFQPVFVPGLLQTGEYARAVISCNVNMPAEEVDERVAARLVRQSLFSRDYPPRFTFYVHEFVLRTPVGGAVVMADQLQHLLRISTRRYVTLRAHLSLAHVPYHRHPLTTAARSPTVRRTTLPRWCSGVLGCAESGETVPRGQHRPVRSPPDTGRIRFGEGSVRVAAPAAQPDGGNPSVPTYSYESPGPAAGPAFVVSRDEVLAKRAALLAEAADFQQFLDNIWDDLRMEPMGGDPVSLDVARAVTDRVRDAEDSYFNVCQQWVNNLYQAAEALAETARQYGYTEEEIAASFTGGAPSV